MNAGCNTRGEVTGCQHMRRRAATPMEVILVVAAGVLVVGLLTPALRAASGRSRDTVCLANLNSIGVAVRTYAGERSHTLPGPVHAALYHNLDDYPYSQGQERFLPWLLRVAADASDIERMITCPTAAGVNPDSAFDHFYLATSRHVSPTHYALNNVGTITSDSGATSGARTTAPAYYFGFSPWLGASPEILELARRNPPRSFGEISNPQREWMIADAWYRKRSNPAFAELQQEGPFQTDWTGEALPHFAPHGARRQRSYLYTDSGQRAQQAADIRQRKADGVTNTLFFDGHVARVPSRTYTVAGFELLYGFSGTVNPAMLNPLPGSPAWQGIWH